ncbi:MAG: hypothetical protein EOP13_07535 [Pseudomonas sp.]|uniref:hypothetical protein n=1 Tax=Pseudomonas sp. TaxID=306 RepID=UPI00121CC679|nr:hypothetical protein [Pseudomonas sp.]RZI74787.1 MAG: hypothetical protein EOP13_07535 [Pseudomonas sp.]
MATQNPDRSFSETPTALTTLSPGARELIASNVKRRLEFQRTPELFHPWWRRCTVKTLIVADGSLNFGEGDFGLSTFVRALRHEAPARVGFQLTLAHIRNVGDAAMLASEPGIANRIQAFRFDNAAHFTPEMYDQIWLFGIETAYATAAGRGPFLAAAEINAIHAHMQRGGGIFATGDHGYLGQALSGGLPRVRGMRHWGDFPSADNNQNHVSMSGPRRNDSNQEGHDTGSSFSDQSDDVPQPLDLLLYSSYAGFLRNARYPHPVFCGRTGRIDVFPDHPHEGECRAPSDASGAFGGADEYPVDASGTRVVPEVIAWGRVRSGNNARGSKSPTVAQTFGVASAYDGHRAGGKGRIVCDSTWHHFVNVNLIGVLEGGGFDEFSVPGEHASKHDGFLASATGLATLGKIKNYYTNVGVWISPPERHACFHRFAWWEIVFSERIVEATLTSPDIPLEKISGPALMHIGIHARDVFARRASQCQSLEWLIDWSRRFIEVAWLDPWDPITRTRLERGDPPLPTTDPMPVLDVALGAALVAMRQQFPFPPDRISDKDDTVALQAIDQGTRFGLRLATKLVTEQVKSFPSLLRVREPG